MEKLLLLAFALTAVFTSFAFNYQGVRLSIGCLSKVRCICIPKQREIIQNIKKNIPASFEYSQFMPWLKQGFLQV